MMTDLEKEFAEIRRQRGLEKADRIAAEITAEWKERQAKQDKSDRILVTISLLLVAIVGITAFVVEFVHRAK